MSKLSDKIRLRHALDSATLILDEVKKRGLSTIFSDPLQMAGVERHLAIIGEAINHLSREYRSDHPEMEWQKITRFRNFLVHEYFAVDYSIVIDIIQVKLPELVTKLTILISNAED